ncbi:leucine-rich repeat and immunoglobulin-like domain-containing nogo receptor-interacting protein 1 [Acanthaster planci]|uniref:Leucine-rich repeat and immunoglobulin-like domain-containing nogo receptor-interacting protein 1 n=1 Tax=Acanthaster planci TaxID=133434 RepID=A0A8B7XIY5_ACAPL|nr:leucine-rich repeat and immunoglobulin-like domain-containing nogo receptor-interacting protein 1 [Acanthaster planci]XP_022079902.1 leucine-rich repeat and immunoglobulin-like domain-containing nogo receptor-interacting protein 1 [Acanthaster planci]
MASMSSISRRVCLPIAMILYLTVCVSSQTPVAGARPPKQNLCVATACTYTVDIALADCNGRHLTCLPLSFNQAVNIDMGQNNIGHLPRGMLTGYFRLRSLDLSNNVISTIADGAFNALRTLKSLTLSFNRINRIGAGTFTGLRNLQNLYLQGNSITSIHVNAFAAMTEIRDLNIAGNQLLTLPDAVFSPMVNIRRLMLQENQLSTTNRFLTGLRSLVELDLDGNRFTTLPDLSGLRMLGDLEVTDSNIRRIKNNSFAGCGRMKELILSSNSIDTIESEGFSGLGDLTDLHLSFNALQTFPEYVFRQLVFLERLYLHNNLLRSLSANHFATLSRLRVLSLGNNQLSVFPPLPASRSLLTLDVTSNHLSTFTKDVLISLPVLNRLLLVNNPLQCDCRLKHLRQWFINSGRRHRSSEIPRCDLPSAMSQMRLTAAPASDLICTPPSVWARKAAVIGLEGHNITLDCSRTGGFPSPIISWRSPNQRELLPDVLSGRYLVSDDGPMMVIRATMADTGLFTCVGTNPAGMATIPVALKVERNPNLPITTAATEGVVPVTPARVAPSTSSGVLKPITPYVHLVTPFGTLPDNKPPDELTPLKPGKPGRENNPRLPGEKPPHSDDDRYWNETNCDTNPTKVALWIFLTFFLTCLLCTVFFWSWYHRLLPRIIGRPPNLRSLKSRRPMSRNIVPLRSRAARAYNQMQSEGVYMRPSAYRSDSDATRSSLSSFEQDSRYVITESVGDPDCQVRRQHILNRLTLKSSGVANPSRHTYINADIIMSESNYTALCTTKDARRSSVQQAPVEPPPEENASQQLQRKPVTEKSVDSRIYMDLS